MDKAGSIRSGRFEFDVAARESQVLGGPPRIPPLSPDAMPPDAAEMIAQVRKTFGIADAAAVPEVVLTTVQHPDLYRSQTALAMQLAAHGAIAPRERELAVLRIAWLLRAPYEWGEHVDISQRFGVTPEEIDRIILGSSAPGWSDHERALLRAVEEMIDDHFIADETWAVLARTWNEKQLLELPILAGVYVGIAFQQNSLRIRLNDNNPGLRHRAARE